MVFQKQVFQRCGPATGVGRQWPRAVSSLDDASVSGEFLRLRRGSHLTRGSTKAVGHIHLVLTGLGRVGGVNPATPRDHDGPFAYHFHEPLGRRAGSCPRHRPFTGEVLCEPMQSRLSASHLRYAPLRGLCHGIPVRQDRDEEPVAGAAFRWRLKSAGTCQAPMTCRGWNEGKRADSVLPFLRPGPDVETRPCNWLASINHKKELQKSGGLMMTRSRGQKEPATTLQTFSQARFD